MLHGTQGKVSLNKYGSWFESRQLASSQVADLGADLMYLLLDTICARNRSYPGHNT